MTLTVAARHVAPLGALQTQFYVFLPPQPPSQSDWAQEMAACFMGVWNRPFALVPGSPTLLLRVQHVTGSFHHPWGSYDDLLFVCIH